MAIHFAPLLIQSSQGLDRFVGGHILRILMMGSIEETAIRTEAAVGAMGQISFHFALFLIQHLCNLFRIDRLDFLVHLRFPLLRDSQLPGSGAPGKTVFTPNQKTVKKEEEHMPQFRKRKGDEHGLSRKDMEGHHRGVIKPLVVSQIPGQKWGDGNEQNEIVIGCRDDSDPGQKETTPEEKGGADQNDKGQPIGDRFRKAPKAQAHGLIQKDIVPEEEKRRHDQTDVEDGRHDRHESIGFPEGSPERGEAISH